MNRISDTQKRKADHIQINLKENVESAITNGLESYHFVHCALPEIDLSQIDTSIQFLGKTVAIPFLISSMTGGTKDAFLINQNLARNAEKFNIAMGVGSQRVGLENDSAMQAFKVRQYAPNILLFANIGAIQLNYSYSVEHCKRIVDAIEADALILHLNPLQESLMVNGDTNFSGLLSKIKLVCKNIPVPVIAKEVGWGISVDVAKKLVDAGIQVIDVAGAGGTSWSEVEKHRLVSKDQKATASAFRDWGIPTAECIARIHQAIPTAKIIASGGLRNGLEIAKCIALGASLGGMARQFLLPASESEENLCEATMVFKKQFEIAMFCVGAKKISELRTGKILRAD